MSDLRSTVDSLMKRLSKLVRRRDVPFSVYQELGLCFREIGEIRDGVRGVLPGFEELASKPKFKAPSLELVECFCTGVRLPLSDAAWFFNHMEAAGWKNNGKPVVSWESTIRAWKLQGGIFPSQKVVNGNGHMVPKPKTLAQQDIERLKAQVGL